MCSSQASDTISIYPRVLVLDVSPPGWAVVKLGLCEALRNVLCLSAATAQPGEQLSIYTVRERHHCLLPLLELRGNLWRLQRCLSELQALPVEGSGGLRSTLLSLAVVDSLQQSKQRMQHISPGAALHSCFVEVTIVSARPAPDLLYDLDSGLEDADLSTLRRLLILHISHELEENGSPETPPDQGSRVYDIDWHAAPPEVLSLEIFFKSWLLERNGEKEKCHLMFCDGASDLDVICDVTRPLLNPGLLHGEEAHPPGAALTAGAAALQEFRVIRAVSSSGVCGSMLYGLASVLTPTACWELDWDQLEANQDCFHALCHCLQLQQVSLVACSSLRGSSAAPPVLSHVLVSAADSAALLLRPLAVRELVLLTKVPPLPATMDQNALHRVQDMLRALDVDVLYNPLQMSSNLYRHLQVTQNRRRHLPTLQGAPGPGRQVPSASRRARATIAPLHFAAPGPSKQRRVGGDRPSPEKRLLHEDED